MTERRHRVERKTNETEVALTLSLDGSGEIRVETGLAFLDHMMSTLALHAGFDLELSCRGDLRVGDHHTVEDCAIALGEALDAALGDRAGIGRFGDAHVLLDDAVARGVIDLSGRPFAAVDLGLKREWLGDVATENLSHFLRSFATAARAGLHVDVLKGDNDHHRAEAAFKATALCLRQAVAPSGMRRAASTKGVLR